ncbi:hypothetical protein Aperf_G00000074783 [Anoplocephala perfoliata]
MDINDRKGKKDGETLPPTLVTSNRRSQYRTSFIEAAGSAEKIIAGLRPSDPTRQAFTLPPKPTHLPPPVPTTEIESESLCSLLTEESFSLPSGAAPPKPPRTTRGNLGKGSFNAYDNDEPLSNEITIAETVPSPKPHQKQPQQPEGGVRMRQSKGWFEETDSEGNSYYTHPDSKDQWIEAASEDGRVYYYERGSHRSVWDLPTVEPRDSISPAANAALKRPISTVNDLLPSAPISSITPGKIPTIELSEAQAKFGARKLTTSKGGDNLASVAAQDDSSSRFYKVSKDHITGPIENKLRGTERRGQVNFTRCNGSRSNKKPLPSVLVLTGPTLYVYKDSKNQSGSTPPYSPVGCGLSIPPRSRFGSDSGMKFLNFLSKGSNVSGKPEVEFHVKNLQVHPVADSDTTFMEGFLQYWERWEGEFRGASPTEDLHLERSDKCILLFQVLSACSLATLVDTSDEEHAQYIIETPSAELRRAWETALRYSKDFDKEDRFDRRALSTRPPPSVDQKVVAMLREFFRKRPPLEKVRELGILKDEPVFGSRLIELCQTEGTKVPVFVTRVIRAVEARGLETSGLYRKSGNGAAIQKLRNQVNHTEYFLNSDEWDIYELSDSLKLFLRELKEPLLLYALYDDFEEFQNSIASFTTEENIARMRSILEKLPECHYATTKMIIEHLSKVAALSSANHMNSKNLALVFGPNMMWRDTPTDDYALFSLVGCACTEFLITNYVAVFAPSSSPAK